MRPRQFSLGSFLVVKAGGECSPQDGTCHTIISRARDIMMACDGIPARDGTRRMCGGDP